MGALSRLLAKVAVRAIRNSRSNEDLYEIANQVVTWSAAGLITESHLSAIEQSMEEQIDEDVSEPTESPSDGSETEVEPSTQDSDEMPSESLSELESMTKAELIEYANEHGVTVSQSWTKAEIIAAIREAA